MNIFIEGSLGTGSSFIGRKIAELTYLTYLNLDDVTDQIAIRALEQSIPMSTESLIDFIKSLAISYRWVSDKLVVFINGEMTVKRQLTIEAIELINTIESNAEVLSRNTDIAASVYQQRHVFI